MPRLAAHEEGLHLRVYQRDDFEIYPLSYEFHVASGPEQSTPAGAQLVVTKKVPSWLREELAAVLGEKRQRKIGMLNYLISGSTAYSRQYAPKGDLWTAGWAAPGLGAFLEAIALTKAKTTHNISTASTSTLPSILRIRQLQKAGLIKLNKTEKDLLNAGNHSELLYSLEMRGQLPIRRPLKTWLMGLGRVIRAAQQKKAG
ncbi:MAG: hypothetical protein WC607_04545 [Candidatus Micrarchaeia archaeon]